MITTRKFCAAKPPKSSAFFGKSLKTMLVVKNYAKNYATIIYQSLRGTLMVTYLEPW